MNIINVEVAMNSKFRFFLLRFSLFVLLSLNVPSLHAQDMDATQGFFIPKFGDWQNDAKDARDAGKQAMFLFFEWDDCPYCQKMRQSALRKTVVQKYFNQYFSPIAVDIVGGLNVKFFDGSNKTEKQIAQQYGIRATPTLMLVDFDGKELYRHVGYFYDEKVMLAFGHFLKNQDYQKQRFKSH